MTTYYVNGAAAAAGDGSRLNPWKTIGKAASTVQPGDIVRVAPGTYSEVVVIETPDTTWTVDGDGSEPVVIDLLYKPSVVFENLTHAKDWTMPGPWDAVQPRKQRGPYTAALAIRANGVTLDGVSGYGWQIRNSWGRLLVMNGNDITVRHVMCQFSYSGAMRGEGNRITMDHCANIRSGVEFFDPDRKKTYIANGYSANAGQGVPTAWTLRGDDHVIRNCYCSLSGGEGFTTGGTRRMRITGNESVGQNHVQLYLICGDGAVVDGNVMWFDMVNCGDFLTNGEPPDNIAIGDEEGIVARYGIRTRTATVVNNVLIGGDVGIATRTNPTNYRTTIEDLYIGFNTILGDSHTRKALLISQAGDRGPHGGVIENNVITVQPGVVPPADYVQGQTTSNMTWQANSYSHSPHATAQGAGDTVGGPLLGGVTLPVIPYHRRADDVPVVSIKDSPDWPAIVALAEGSPARDSAYWGAVGGHERPWVAYSDIAGRPRFDAADRGAVQSVAVLPDPDPPIEPDPPVDPDPPIDPEPPVDPEPDPDPATPRRHEFTLTGAFEPGETVVLAVQNPAGDTLALLEVSL
jgi:hypothetical protein